MTKPKFYEVALPAVLPEEQEWLSNYHENSRKLIEYMAEHGAGSTAFSTTNKCLNELRLYLLEKGISYSPEAGECWFRDYRWQIRLIGTHIYKNVEWSKDIWVKMCEVDESKYNSIELFPAEKIKSYLVFNRDRDRSLETTPSPDFPPELVDKFCVDAVAKFTDYLNSM